MVIRLSLISSIQVCKCSLVVIQQIFDFGQYSVTNPENGRATISMQFWRISEVVLEIYQRRLHTGVCSHDCVWHDRRLASLPVHPDSLPTHKTAHHELCII